LVNATTAGTDLFQFLQADYDAYTAAIAAANVVYNAAESTQADIDTAEATLIAATNLYYTQQIVPEFTPTPATLYLITNKANTGYFSNDGTTAIVSSNPPDTGWEFVNVSDSIWVIKSGENAVAKSLNMVAYDATSTDQQWYVHYDGPMANNVFTPVAATEKLYFSFSANGRYDNVIQQNSTGTLQITAGHNHSTQSQWFTIDAVGAPITAALQAKIAEVTARIAATTVGTAYNQFPQAARDALVAALAVAQDALDNSASSTQTQINEAANTLNDALTAYNNAKNVWHPEENMAYFIGNRGNVKYLSVDSLDVSAVAGYNMDEVSFTKQLWHFVSIENKPGFYYIVNGNKALTTPGGGSIAVSVAEFIPGSSTQWEVVYYTNNNNTDYFSITAVGSTYPVLAVDATHVWIDRYPGTNTYQAKMVPAGALRTEVIFAQQLLDSVTVGNQFGQTPQSAYDDLLAAIEASIAIATDGNTANDADQYDALLAAEDLFRATENGYGLDLAALNAAIATAAGFIETTTVVGSAEGQCPQTVIDALAAAIAAANDATGVADQADVDAKVTALLADIETFKTDLVTSTGLAALITASQQQHAAAVEGVGAGQYQEGSKAIFQAAIDVATAALAAQPVLQADLLAAYAALQVAIENFNAAQNPPIDVDGLTDAIADVQAFLQGKPATDYTELREVLAEAQALLENPSATQDEIDAMEEALLDALQAAEEWVGVENTNSALINVFASQGTLYINNVMENCKIKVFDLSGKLVMSDNILSNTVTFQLNPNVYLVNLRGETVNKTVKIIVE
jgi:hypothetical protein